MTGLRARNGKLNVHKLVDLGLASLEEVGAGLLADLALEGLPVHAHQILCLFSL